MRKKYIWLISIVVVIIIILIGGKLYMNKADKQETESKKEMQQVMKAEKYMALYVVRNYDDVQNIKFRPITQTKETGFWHGSMNINDGNTLTFSMRDLSDFEDITIRTNPTTFGLNKKTTSPDGSLDHVEVEYWSGNSGN